MRWLLSLPLLTLGLLVHLLTLSTMAAFIRDCLRKGRFGHRSGIPVVGPVLISLGLWVAPWSVPAWIYGLPWGLEVLAFLLAGGVRRATRSGPA